MTMCLAWRRSTRRGTKASSARTCRRRGPARRSRRPTAVSNGADELRDDALDLRRGVHELNARAVEHRFLVDVGNAAVDDSSFDDDRAVAERQTKLVQ